MPPFSPEGPAFYLWVGAFTAGGLFVLAGLLFLLLQSRPGSLWLQLRLGMLTASLAVLGVVLFAMLQSWEEPIARFALQVLTCSGCLGFLLAIRRSGSSAGWPSAAALVCVGLLLAGSLTWRLERDSQAGEMLASDIPTIEDLELGSTARTEGTAAVTDLGRPIPVYTTLPKKGTMDEVLAKAKTLRSALPLPAGVSVVAAPDGASNCYGWVFTGGRFFVGGSDVAKILDDNGYRRVESPSPGDLIVYRDDSDRILHVGLVRATGQEQFVLIESKMGWIGSRLLHPPEMQNYSQNFTYYHSPRNGHVLAGLTLAQKSAPLLAVHFAP